MSGGCGSRTEETSRSGGPEGSGAAIAAVAASLGLPVSSIEALTNTLTANSTSGDVLPTISSILNLEGSVDALAVNTVPISARTSESESPAQHYVYSTSTAAGSTAITATTASEEKEVREGKDSNTATGTAAAAALFPCLIYYPSSNNYSLVWVPMDGSSTAVVSQASQAMAGSGAIVWPGLGTPSSTTPISAPVSTSASTDIQIPSSPSITSALSGLVGQNYMQLLQTLQQQQQQLNATVSSTTSTTEVDHSVRSSPQVTPVFTSTIVASSSSPLPHPIMSSSLLSSPTTAGSLTLLTPQRHQPTSVAVSSPQVEFSTGSQIQLWQFLLELLTDRESQTCIKWTNKIDWEFKITDPPEVARRWGDRKGKPTMNYEKLSRGLRYYYDKNIIKKVPNQRYVYRFVCDLESLLGLSFNELQKALAATAEQGSAITIEKKLNATKVAKSETVQH